MFPLPRSRGSPKKNERELRGAIFERGIKAGIAVGAKAVVNEDLVWPFSWVAPRRFGIRTCRGLPGVAAH